MTILENNDYTGKLEVIEEGKARGQFYATANLQVGCSRKRWTVGAATREDAKAAAERKAREFFAELSSN